MGVSLSADNFHVMVNLIAANRVIKNPETFDA